jgi:hypothetical protein
LWWRVAGLVVAEMPHRRQVAVEARVVSAQEQDYL